ncbi:hypothetical protein ACLOJK_025754, partial [Asimina triloba]
MPQELVSRTRVAERSHLLVTHAMKNKICNEGNTSLRKRWRGSDTSLVGSLRRAGGEQHFFEWLLKTSRGTRLVEVLWELVEEVVAKLSANLEATRAEVVLLHEQAADVDGREVELLAELEAPRAE